MREIVIRANDGGQRLDKFLKKALPSVPPSLLYKSIRTKKIKVNRKRADGAQMLCCGDVLQLFLAEELFCGFDTDRSERTVTLSRIKADLDVIYEDENILLIYKPSGISVHEDEDGGTAHLLTYLQAYLYKRGEYNPEDEQSFTPALCNRIDRNTEGIVIAAKNAESLRIMNEKIRNREIDKYYLCAVHGTMPKQSELLRAYLLKNEKENKVRIFDKNPPSGAKEIRTEYKVLETKNDLSLLEVHLLTGRTHQIRAHLAHIGHPIVGDGKYGINRDDRAMGYKYQALCSYRLTFSFNTENKTPLDYLNNKTFTVSDDKIYFRELFT